jgi:predicted nucleic acid binding AN1-type Zn finger protein
MFSCKEISKVSCNEEDLKGFDRFNYKMHLFMCDKCKKYVASLRKVEEAFKKIILRRSVASESDIKKIEDEVLEKIKTTKSDS